MLITPRTKFKFTLGVVAVPARGSTWTNVLVIRFSSSTRDSLLNERKLPQISTNFNYSLFRLNRNVSFTVLIE